jgi:hypothetical protein
MFLFTSDGRLHHHVARSTPRPRRSARSAIARDRLPRHLGRHPSRRSRRPRPSVRFLGCNLMRVLGSGVVCGLHSCRLEVHCERAGASPRRRTCVGTPPPWRPTALPIDRSRPPQMAWPLALAPGRLGRRSPRTRACAGSLCRSPPRPHCSWFLAPSLAPVGARPLRVLSS